MTLPQIVLQSIHPGTQAARLTPLHSRSLCSQTTQPCASGSALPSARGHLPAHGLLLGLVWVLVFYISGTLYPIPGIKEWNLIIGFGIAFVGFLMTTRWR